MSCLQCTITWCIGKDTGITAQIYKITTKNSAKNENMVNMKLLVCTTIKAHYKQPTFEVHH